MTMSIYNPNHLDSEKALVERASASCAASQSFGYWIVARTGGSG